MMIDFALKNRGRFAEMLGIEEEKPTTGTLITLIKEDYAKLNLLYSIVISFWVHEVLRNVYAREDIGEGSLVLDFLSLKSSEFSKFTGLKMPMKVPHSSTLLVLVVIFFIVILTVFYILIEFTDYLLPIILFTGISFVFTFSILIWGLFLKIFRKTLGKQTFAGVVSINSLFDEMIKDNEIMFSHEGYSFLHKSLQKIDSCSDKEYNKWQMFDRAILSR